MNSRVKNETVRVGIAGLGRSGWALHAQVLRKMPDKFSVQAVFDVDDGRASDAAHELQCTKAPTFHELVNDPKADLVVLALPSSLHESGAVEAITAGKHVLVEKPFATSSAGARRMIEAARKRGTIVTCNQNLRFAPDFQKVREIVKSGLLGKTILIRIAWHGFKRRWDWQTLKELGGGSLNNDGSHVIDQALLLMGDGELQVHCAMARTPLCLGDAEDHVKVILQGKDMPLADLEMTNACALPQDPWLILGTKGSLSGSKAKLRWKRIDETALSEKKVSREPTPDRSYNKEEFAWLEGSYDVPQEPYEMSVERLYASLFDALRGTAPLEVTPESLIRQIRILEKCQRSGEMRVLGSW